MSLQSLCNAVCDVRSNAATAPDAYGNTADDWSDLYTDTACRVRPLSAREQTRWGERPTIATHRVYFADPTLAITEAMRIVFGTRTFHILGVVDTDEQSRLLYADCEEIKV